MIGNDTIRLGLVENDVIRYGCHILLVSPGKEW